MEPLIISAVAELKHGPGLFETVAFDFSASDPPNDKLKELLEKNELQIFTKAVKEE